MKDATYDLVIALECIHDMGDPISVLRTVRSLAGDNGTIIVVDERVAESFGEVVANHDPVEQAMYRFSCLCCLVDGKSRPNSAATGTVMRPSIFRIYAQQAGFKDIEILPAEHDFFRFYKLLQYSRDDHLQNTKKVPRRADGTRHSHLLVGSGSNSI